MRIALLIPTLDGGGAERALLNLSRGFAEHGHTVSLVLRRATGTYLSLVDPRVEVIDLASKRLLTAMPSLVRYLRRDRPDVLISTMAYTNLAALVASRVANARTQVIVNEQIHLSKWIASSDARVREHVLPLVVRFAYPHAAAIVAASEGVARDLEAIIGVDSVVDVINNPVATPELLELSRSPVDHPWFANEGPAVILGVGRLMPQKDFPTLIRAFARVRQKRPARLVILGEGPERPSLDTLASELGVAQDVAMPGFMTNPYSFMRAADVFVLSSVYEGFGNVLVESLTVGTPIVSTNCESGPAEVLRNGELGRLVPVGDDLAMAKAIEATLDSPPDVSALQARAQDFTPYSAAARFTDIIQRRAPRIADGRE